jgi:Tol biopolymer transport system component
MKIFKLSILIGVSLLIFSCEKEKSDNNAQNIKPIADAGADQMINIGDTAFLYGVGSTNPTEAELSYSWTLVSKPLGSEALLTNTEAIDPYFIPGVEGEYIIQLIVGNGEESSNADSVVITAIKGNIAPLSNAGIDQKVVVTKTVQLDGNESYDENEDTMDYSWSIVSAPEGSVAKISDIDIVNPTFAPDVPGEYSIRLIVNDATATAEPDTVSVTAIKPVFAFQRNWDIYVMDMDTSHAVNITNTPVEENSPKWSPNGLKIAFVSTMDNNYEIYTVDWNGENLVRLTNNPSVDDNPVWSPDGSKILFNRGGESKELYVMDADGTNQLQLTYESNRDGQATAVWSPDGAKILFSKNRTGLFIVNADGTNEIEIYGNTITHGFDWSPKGDQIAFSNDGIYTMNIDGSNLKNVSNEGWDYWPIYSPDGSKLLFQETNLYVIDLNNTGITLLDKNVGWRLDAQNWSPLGDKIVFYKMNIDKTWSVYTVNSDGSDLKKLTAGNNDLTPRWRPLGN